MSTVVAITAIGSPIYGQCARETVLSVLENTPFDVFITCDQSTIDFIPSHERVQQHVVVPTIEQSADPYLFKFETLKTCLEKNHHEFVIHIDVDAVVVRPIREQDVVNALGTKSMAMIEQSVIIGTDYGRPFFYKHFIDHAMAGLTPNLPPPDFEEFRHYNSGVVIFTRDELERVLYWVNDPYFHNRRHSYAGRMIADQDFLQVWSNVVHRGHCAQLGPEWNHCWLWDENFPQDSAKILHFSNFTYGPNTSLPEDLRDARTGQLQSLTSSAALTFVVVTHNSAEVLGDCLRPLQRFTESEIIVVDNNSADDSAEVATRLGAKVVINSENLGFARAVNQGVKLASHNVVCLVNPDAYVSVRAVRLAIEQLTPGTMLVPDFVHGDGSTAHGVQSGYNRRKLFADLVSKGFIGLVNKVLRSEGGNRTWQWPIAACLFFTVEDWEKLGGLNERYFLYMEDADLGLRAFQLGIKIESIPTVIFHNSRTGSQISDSHREKFLTEARLQFARENYGHAFSSFLRVSRTLAIRLRQLLRAPA